MEVVEECIHIAIIYPLSISFSIASIGQKWAKYLHNFSSEALLFQRPLSFMLLPLMLLLMMMMMLLMIMMKYEIWGIMLGLRRIQKANTCCCCCSEIEQNWNENISPLRSDWISHLRFKPLARPIYWKITPLIFANDGLSLESHPAFKQREQRNIISMKVCLLTNTSFNTATAIADGSNSNR